jgi:hypothetical protein
MRDERSNERQEEEIHDIPIDKDKMDEAKTTSEISEIPIALPSQSVTDLQARIMTLLGALLLVASLVPVGAAVWSLVTTRIDWEAAPTGANLTETASLYLPILLAPAALLFAAGSVSVIGYLLMRAGYGAAREIIPEKDRVLVSAILQRADTEEAMNQYIRLRSLTGVTGFFTKMNLSGLPLATIVLTLIFTVLAIWAEPFFDLAKLTLGVFLGSYVQQNVGPKRNL